MYCTAYILFFFSGKKKTILAENKSVHTILGERKKNLVDHLKKKKGRKKETQLRTEIVSQIEADEF